MRGTIAFVAVWIVALAAAGALAPAAHAEGTSLTSWLDAVPGQWGGGSGDASSDSVSGKPLTVSGGMRLFVFARTLKTTHVSGRPRQWSFPFQHTQTDDDSSWYVVHRVGAITITGDYALNRQMQVRAAVLLGAMAGTLEYRVGSGNPFFGGATDYSVVLDTKVGYYPLDMFYGLDLEGSYAMGEFVVGARVLTHVGSAPFEESAMIWGVVEGWLTYLAFDTEVVASYKTKYGAPWAGLGMSLYRGWSHQETVADNTPEDYHFDFRESMPFSFVGGYRVESKDGLFIALEFAMIGKWSFGMEVGMKVM